MQEMQETSVQSQGQDNPLEEERQLTLVSLSGKSHGQRSLVGYSPWGCKESDMTEQLSMHILLVAGLVLVCLSFSGCEMLQSIFGKVTVTFELNGGHIDRKSTRLNSSHVF